MHTGDAKPKPISVGDVSTPLAGGSRPPRAGPSSRMVVGSWRSSKSRLRLRVCVAPVPTDRELGLTLLTRQMPHTGISALALPAPTWVRSQEKFMCPSYGQPLPSHPVGVLRRAVRRWVLTNRGCCPSYSPYRTLTPGALGVTRTSIVPLGFLPEPATVDNSPVTPSISAEQAS